MRRWYVVQAKPGQERTAEANLLRQGYRAYLPRLKSRRKAGGGRWITVPVPLFPGYLFVELDVTRQAWRSINGTIGAIGLVSFGPRPSPLPDGVIEGVRAREGADGLVELDAGDAAARYKPGDRVAIADGPLAEADGLFQAADGRKRVVVLMRLLGREVPVRVRGDQIRAAS
ncbi:MAG: transcription termination/antitermination NusG family protein [Marivibrio sp.]|uniref:transcription termination/antitermination protein NusG n=1 Tax=Marivibrio sp. TaxID=2039719 RepID=UPI0032ECEC25